jgi:hypothetical protein
LKNQSSQATRVLTQARPDLIRVVGALTFLAVAVQVGAHCGIEAWLDAQLFAAGTLGPAPVQIGPDTWSAKVGATGSMATVNLEAIIHHARHYELLAMAISWTIAAAVSVLCMRIDPQAPVSAAHLRPARAVPLLAPASM